MNRTTQSILMAILFVVSLAMVIIGQREVGYDWHFVSYTSV